MSTKNTALHLHQNKYMFELHNIVYFTHIVIEDMLILIN